jgi:uncharacterized protein DUF4390
MTVFFTRCCRRLDLRCAFIALWLGMAAALPVHAQGIEIRKASVTIAEDAYVLDAQFDIALTHTLEDVLNKGVPLYFQLEFELVRSRWYWFNDRVSSWQQQHRLSYNALTRQYRLGVGNLYQNYGSLAEALEVMSRVRRRQEIEPGSLRRDTAYSAALRFRLDTSQLPKPFQLNAVGSREWYVGSDWLRWNLTP